MPEAWRLKSPLQVGLINLDSFLVHDHLLQFPFCIIYSFFTMFQIVLVMHFSFQVSIWPPCFLNTASLLKISNSYNLPRHFIIHPPAIESQIFDSTLVNNGLTLVNYMKDSIHPFLDNASPLRHNLVILYGDSKAFMMDAMNRLNEHRDTFNIRLVGLPQVERFTNLDNTQANNMNLTYFSTNYIDYNSNQTERFIKKFREEYKTEPGIYGFNGFDVTYYFLNALFNLDDRLSKCLEHVPLDLMLTRYKFGKAKGAANYQNTYWNLIRYEGLTKRKLPDPVNQENE